MLIEKNSPHGGYIGAAGNPDTTGNSDIVYRLRTSLNQAGNLTTINVSDRPLDFSANINPLGMPDSVRAALHTAVDECTGYPETSAFST